MTPKWISKIGFVLFFLLVFNVSRNGFTFEGEEDVSAERERTVFSPIKGKALETPSALEESENLRKRKQSSVEVDTDQNQENISKKPLRKIVKITLSGALQLHDFVENFREYSRKLILTLKDISSTDLPKLLEFLDTKQIRLKGLKFEHPSFEKDEFPLIDEEGALHLFNFFVKNKKNLSSFTVFEMTGHPIGYKGLSALCDALSEIETLKNFYVAHVGEDETESVRNELLEQQLKKLLTKCVNLEKLNLTNALSPFLLDDMAPDFARPPLRVLDLSSNFFDGESAESLLDVLKGKKNLRLILRENNVYPHEIKKLKIETLGFEVDLSDQDVM